MTAIRPATPEWRRWLRASVCLGAVAALAACSSGPRMSAPQEAAQYQAKAARNYAPPGPPSDPWGPYIIEASTTYDVPDRWIREVMRQESGGQVMSTSGPGAMGLMQIMPATYDELRARYSLGDDPYYPHDNIMAGTAYIRELYDLYGSPGFLAAYNAGPGRFDDYLNRHKTLPDETRNYVARIGPRIVGSEPQRPSQAGAYASNQIPLNIPSGPRYPSRPSAPTALADTRRSGLGHSTVQVATLAPPVPPPSPPPASRQPMAVASSTPPAGSSFHLIPQAMADTLPRQVSSGSSWAIQVGAFGNEALARAAAETARNKVQLLGARPMVGQTRQASTTLYRARVIGLTHESAVQACEKLGKSGSNCIVLSPDAQG